MKNRIIGALLILLVSIPVLWGGGTIFTVACGILCLFALKEMIDLKKHHEPIPKIIFVFSELNICLFFFLYGKEPLSFQINSPWIAFTILGLFVPCLFYKKKKYSIREAMYLLASFIFLILFFNSLNVIRFQNLWILLYLIFISIFTDTFAYLIGFFFGKHKCTPSISPNKTWEGCIGGVVMGVLLSTIFYFYKIGSEKMIEVFILSTILSIMGLLGDLVFSKMKRENQIKDFSNLIPGHGGILDRLDSLLFIVLTYIWIMGMK